MINYRYLLVQTPFSYLPVSFLADLELDPALIQTVINLLTFLLKFAL